MDLLDCLYRKILFIVYHRSKTALILWDCPCIKLAPAEKMVSIPVDMVFHLIFIALVA